MTAELMLPGIQGKLLGQVNLAPMDKLANAYLLSVEGAINGKILKVYS